MKAICVLLLGCSTFASDKPDFSPPIQEKQLPRAMHSEMKLLPQITVGQTSADIVAQLTRPLARFQTIMNVIEKDSGALSKTDVDDERDEAETIAESSAANERANGDAH